MAIGRSAHDAAKELAGIARLSWNVAPLELVVATPQVQLLHVIQRSSINDPRQAHTRRQGGVVVRGAHERPAGARAHDGPRHGSAIGD